MPGHTYAQLLGGDAKKKSVKSYIFQTIKPTWTAIQKILVVYRQSSKVKRRQKPTIISKSNLVKRKIIKNSKKNKAVKRLNSVQNSLHQNVLTVIHRVNHNVNQINYR